MVVFSNDQSGLNWERTDAGPFQITTTVARWPPRILFHSSFHVKDKLDLTAPDCDIAM
jgi:hypothetical protein